jgi:uncharacterized protein (DUF924 family)
MSNSTAANGVIDFWFSEHARSHWFKSTSRFDRQIAEQFKVLHRQATDGQLASWEDTPTGSLALILLLDQFTRNIYRGRPDTYMNDSQARDVARRAIASGFDCKLPDAQRAFIYMPFMHSESLEDQDLSVKLFVEAGLDNARYALQHRDIVRRFGRFPHRNAILGRQNSPEEQEYLASDEAFRG